MTAWAEKLRAMRQVAVAKGLCYTCRCRPAKPGTRYCADCIAQSSAKTRATEAKRRAEGRCPECGAPPAIGRRMCLTCAAKSAAWRRAKADARLADGLCVRCGAEPFVPGRSQCHACLLAQRERLAARNPAPTIVRHCVLCGSTAHDRRTHHYETEASS